MYLFITNGKSFSDFTTLLLSTVKVVTDLLEKSGKQNESRFLTVTPSAQDCCVAPRRLRTRLVPLGLCGEPCNTGATVPASWSCWEV